MSKFDEILGKPVEVPEDDNYVPVDGSFQCSSCSEPVDEARWYMLHRVLTWVCTKGHKSLMENFG